VRRFPERHAAYARGALHEMPCRMIDYSGVRRRTKRKHSGRVITRPELYPSHRVVHYPAALWHSVQYFTSQPSWLAGVSGTASMAPAVWHIAQLSRPSRAWGIGLGSAV
jgi:hypothetical protein